MTGRLGGGSENDDEEHIGCEMNICAVCFIFFPLSRICRDAVSDSDAGSNRNFSCKSRKHLVQTFEVKFYIFCDLSSVENRY
jgi:hypothetical protein